MQWRPELGDHFSAVSDEDAFTAADLAKVFTQAILEFADANGLHSLNVASWSYIVNRSMQASDVMSDDHRRVSGRRLE